MSDNNDYVTTEQWREKTAHIRKRKKPSQEKEKPIPSWEREQGAEPQPPLSMRWYLYGVIAIICFIVVGMILLNLSGKSGGYVVDNTAIISPIESPQEKDPISLFIRDAEQVARAFLSDIDEEKRLNFVRNQESVLRHLDRYPEDARHFSVKSIKLQGYSEGNGSSKCAYAVELTNGNYRLLNILQTDNGLKVDWDSFARYCSASWSDLLSGTVTEAEVRVFVMPADHQVAPFEDSSQWTCFQLMDAESGRMMYGYAPAKSKMARLISARIMRNRTSRQHVTLKISSDGETCKRGLFVIDEFLAMGWVKRELL